MKKTLKIVFIILFIILIKFTFTISLNKIIILNYNKNIYNTNIIKLLYIFNWPQSYIVYYNEGNLLYKEGKYSLAITKYKKAISKKPPQNRICDVRINLSLSMIKQIKKDSSYKKVYQQLEEAKKNLYHNDCAHENNDNGYSKQAENLEKEIKELQAQLNNNDNNSDSKSETETNENNSNVEEQLKEIEKKSGYNRQKDLTNYENIEDYSYYSGKKW